MTYAVNMNTSTRYIGCHHHFGRAALKGLQGFHASVLGYIARQQTSFKAFLIEFLLEGSADISTVSENHYAVHIITDKNIVQ